VDLDLELFAVSLAELLHHQQLEVTICMKMNKKHYC